MSLVLLALPGAAAPQVSEPGDPPVAVDESLLRTLGEHIIQGETEQALELVQQALAAARHARDERSEAALLLLKGLALGSARDVGPAAQSLEHSIALLEQQGDFLGKWIALLSWGELEKNSGDFEASVTRYESALEALKQLEAPSASLSLDLFTVLSPIFGASAEPLKQLKGMTAVVKPFLVLFAEAGTRDGLGSVLVELGRLEAAEIELGRAAEISTMFGGLFDVSIALHLGELRRRQWRLEEARQVYERALRGAGQLPMAPGLREAWVEVRVLTRLAEIDALRGEIDEALAWNDQALEAVRQAGVDAKRADVLQERAEILRFADRTAEAEETLEEALLIAEAGEHRYRAGLILTDLGFHAMLRNDFESAARHLEGATRHLQDLNYPYLEAAAWSLLTETYFALSSNEQAAHALAKARGHAEESGFRLAEGLVEVLEVWKLFRLGEGSLEDVAKAYAAFWELPEAGGLLIRQGEAYHLPRIVSALFAVQLDATGTQQSLEKLATASVPYIPLTARFLLGQLKMQDGDLEAAREVWTSLLEETRSQGIFDFAAGISASIAASYVPAGDTGKTIEYLAEAVRLLEQGAQGFRVEELLADYLGSERRLYYGLLIEALVRAGRMEQAFDFAERSRARTFLSMLGRRRLRASPAGDPALVAEAESLRAAMAHWEQARRRPSAGPAASEIEDLERLRSRYQDVMVRLKIRDPEYVSLVHAEPLDLEAVQRQLGSDTSLVSYFVGPLSVHAWVVDGSGLEHVELPMERSGLGQIICWIEQLESHEDFRKDQRGEGAEKSPIPGCRLGEAAEEELYERLIAPVRPHLRHSRVLLVPHGELHYVPFAALRNPQSGRYLVEDLTLSYVPSASVLGLLRAKETSISGKALVLGNPASSEPGVSRLKAAAEEAETVAKMLGTSPLLDHKATEECVSRTPGVDLIHLAAHGVYEPGNPLFSRILLAGEGASTDKARPLRFDGSLSVEEIFGRLDLTGVNLVVLSACKTARGERSGGDEIVGLTRAFLYAGSPSVISTLWSVDDQASARLMEAFYREWIRGASIAEALRQAQIETLHAEGFEDPYFWAAFNLTGDPQGRWPGNAERESSALGPLAVGPWGLMLRMLEQAPPPFGPEPSSEQEPFGVSRISPDRSPVGAGSPLPETRGANGSAEKEGPGA